MATRPNSSPKPDDAARLKRAVRPAPASPAGVIRRAGPHSQSDAQASVANSATASPADILALQRTYGNRAVGHLLGDKARTRPVLQAKLTVGPAGDRYEQEADQVANQVMRAPAAASPGSIGQQGVEEQPVQRSRVAAGITPLVQRHAVPPKPDADDEKELEEPEERPPVQREAADRADGGFEADPGLEQRLAHNPGRGLPPKLRGEMETRFGADFAGVRVHANSEAGQLNRELSAHAFTHGSDIYFGAGKYNPDTSGGKHLLAHELTHVVQQGAAASNKSPAQRKPAEIQRADIFEPKLWTKGGRKKKQPKSYNVLKGLDLPNLETMSGRRLREMQDLGTTAEIALLKKNQIFDAQYNIDDPAFMRVALRAAKQTNAQVADDMVDPVSAAIRAKLQGATDVEVALKQATDAVKQKRDDGDTLMEARAALAQAFADRTIAFTQVKLKGHFWRDRAGQMPAYLPKGQRALFSAALKQMPTVAALLNPNPQGNVQLATSTWKDGGTLAGKIESVNDLVGPKKPLGPGRMASTKFLRKLNRVDRMVKMMVEAEFLAQIPRPRVRVHATAAQDVDVPWGFRAHYNGNESAVHLAYNEPANVMAHEVGHHLEGYLPMERWHDVHVLLGARHEAAGGGKAKSGATPPFTHLSEGRYGGKYVTGKYTSTAYRGGNAEVVSMAMEYFAKPSKALKLIDGDPQHAAIVLRSFRPGEYQTTDALRGFDQYLPHK